MAIEEEPEPGIPEWVVTFGDMMSLLLTFFIMLVSMSEIKEDEQYQAMVESIREQFGHDSSMASMVPGDIRPRNSQNPSLAESGRAKKIDKASGGQENKSVVGEHKKVQIVRPGDDSSIGGLIYFDEDSAELSEENKRNLYRIIHQIAGKPQKVEVRGHTSRRPVDPASGNRDHTDLAYSRSRNTAKFLVESGIHLKRIRISSAGASEPLYDGVDPDLLARNSRVQILMWDERVKDLEADSEVALEPDAGL
ncbi:OmpA/MotB family protein [Adhaeretor mobilis]|uniref:Motility protein B n=1 Tax=Adhaeretor mobilis TaxID=1930276 RepID=A0A517MYT0_9BACT|nr:flagellar motor protein MotB [Adhaeretor mobilis]QDT00043.1 Motility protein B [Adhaeretor mobilis]